MKVYALRGTEMTSSELFDDFHKRMGLRNKISNALMAIALFEVRSTSKNLTRYIADGLNVSQECISSLDEIARGDSSFKYRYYASKVLLDILTKRPNQDIDIGRVQEYRKGFSAAQTVFQTMQEKGELDRQMVKEAEQLMKEIDKEIESTYAKEESLYRGSFLPR